jgi:hypothetical protein
MILEGGECCHQPEDANFFKLYFAFLAYTNQKLLVSRGSRYLMTSPSSTDKIIKIRGALSKPRVDRTVHPTTLPNSPDEQQFISGWQHAIVGNFHPETSEKVHGFLSDSGLPSCTACLA